MNDQELIEAALQRASELAPDGHRIAAGLHAHIRTQRQRRAVVIGGGMVLATGAVLAGIPFLRRASLGDQAPTDLGSVGPMPAYFPVTPIPPTGPIGTMLFLRPGWLPKGLVEVSRTAAVGTIVTEGRMWGTMGAGSGLVSLALSPTTSDVNLHLDFAAPNTTINGMPGWADSGADFASVDWLLGGGMVATVHVSGFDNAGATAYRVASAVGGDELEHVAVGIRFGWLPDQVPSDRLNVSVYRTPNGLSQLLAISTAEADLVKAKIQPELTGGKPSQTVRVRGADGFIAESDEGRSVVVPLDDGRWLTVETALLPGGQADLLRLADEIAIGPDPVVHWLP